MEKIEEAQAKAIDYTVVYLDKQTGIEVWREKKSYTPVTKENELDKDATVTVKPEISSIKELEGYRIEGEQEKTLTLSPSKDNVIDFTVAAAGKKRGVREAGSTSKVTITKDNFTKYFTTVGDATYDSSTGIAVLTPPVTEKVGTIALKTKLDGSSDFTFNFDFNHQLMGTTIIKLPNIDIERRAVDGIGLVLSPEKQGRIGYGGASLGIVGLKDAFGFKIDTSQNIDPVNPEAPLNSYQD